MSGVAVVHTSTLCARSSSRATPERGEAAAYQAAARAGAIAFCRHLIAHFGIQRRDLEQGGDSPAPKASAKRPRLQPAAVATSAPQPAAPRITRCPSISYDPRYQVDPSQPFEGAGFMAEWKRRTAG